MANATWKTLGSNDLSAVDLNSLADAAFKNLAEIDNTSGLNTHAIMEIDNGATLAAGAGQPHLAIYICPVLDGTNPPDPPGTSAVQPPLHYLRARIHAVASTNFTRGSTDGPIEIPGCKFRVVVQNVMGASFASSGTAVDFRRTNIEIA